MEDFDDDLTFGIEEDEVVLTQSDEPAPFPLFGPFLMGLQPGNVLRVPSTFSLIKGLTEQD